MTKKLKLDPDKLHFLSLGGSEEFGVNFNLYATDNKWLAVDCGIGFADWRLPGVDILLPDPAFLEERRKDLSAIIITHAHEDHVGALAYLWPRLRAPIYCTPYTAAILEQKFKEFPDCRDADVNVVKAGDTIDAGPFKVTFVHVTHSIPDATSLIIETEAGRVVHSADWNIDPTPVINGQTDEKTFRAAGDKGVMAYIGDSTNALTPGRAGSEGDVEKGLDQLMADEKKGALLVTIFATNTGRLQSICRAAKKHGRKVVLAGRSLHKHIEAAKACGYLQDVAPFIDQDEAADMPRGKLVIVAAGSQAQHNAALTRIIHGDNPRLKVKSGDVFVFSSRVIPGNERAIYDLTNILSGEGVRILTPHRSPYKIHVSGHPCQDEINDMLDWVRPDTLVTVHGERAMLEKQAAMGRDKGIKNIVIPGNGKIVALQDGQKPKVVAEIKTGMLAVEPKRILDVEHEGIAERRRLQYRGAVFVSLVLDERGDVVDHPQVDVLGLLDLNSDEDRELEQDIYGEIKDILADMDRDDRRDDHAVHEEVRIGVRRLIQIVLGFKPYVTVHVSRV
ncbi:MAG: ribonuclease J [Rhodospirillales bacterium]|nr:ribonuclease J [Rhodospirillales bacterium]